MKRILTLVLAAGMLLGAASGASAIDFKAKGQWIMGFSAGEGALHRSTKDALGNKTKTDSSDVFTAAQRVRLQLEAVASESLSGTVYFEMGDTTWGRGDTGGALGADGKIIELKQAFIDWIVPNTDLKVRMGIQPVTMPNAAGGSGILDDDVAGVVLNYQFNENVGLTAFWARPYNDNYVGENTYHANDKSNYLDNVDLFSIALPLTFDGISATPWVMYGVIGQNAFRQSYNYRQDYVTNGYHDSGRWRNSTFFDRGPANTSAFWAGIPVKLSLWDPLNIEFDFNYGYVESMGEGWMERRDGSLKRYDSRREGFLVKALIEYKMDWGTPGIFGWYASGDDGNPGNGSERMPTISPCGNFTSFLGDGNKGWSSNGTLYDRNLSYAGTWGIGLQIKDMSFLEDLKHTFRVAYWGGTNSPSMAKYANSAYSWGSSFAESGSIADPEVYLTTNDALVEFNLVNSYQMYENFEVNLELGYIINCIDRDTWKRANYATSYEKQDAWKAQLIFAYTF